MTTAKVHWTPGEAVSWPSGPGNMRTFHTGFGNVCGYVGSSTLKVPTVTCARCHRVIEKARYEATGESTGMRVRSEWIEDRIARTIEGADHLLVITDKLEECSTQTVTRLAAFAAGEAYRLAAEQLRVEGRNEVARETFKKAQTCFERGNHPRKALECQDAAIRLYPDNGHIYA